MDATQMQSSVPMQGMKSPQEMPPVAVQLGKHDDAVTSVHDALTKLEARLSPVLSPPFPDSPLGDAMAEVRPPAGVVLDELRTKTSLLYEARARIEALIDRLEV